MGIALFMPKLLRVTDTYVRISSFPVISGNRDEIRSEEGGYSPRTGRFRLWPLLAGGGPSPFRLTGAEAVVQAWRTNVRFPPIADMRDWSKRAR